MKKILTQKIYIFILLALGTIYMVSGLTGYKYFNLGNSEKWSPDGNNYQHK